MNRHSGNLGAKIDDYADTIQGYGFQCHFSVGGAYLLFGLFHGHVQEGCRGFTFCAARFCRFSSHADGLGAGFGVVVVYLVGNQELG